MDKLDIRLGQRWELEVESALNGCSRLLVIVSPASVASRNVLAEAAFAIDEGKEVIPVLIQECKIPFRLRPFQYADLSSDYSSGLHELLADLMPAHGSATIDTTGQGRLEEERQKAAAEQARLEQEERERKAAQEKAQQEELERQRVVAEQARLEEERQQAAEKARLEQERERLEVERRQQEEAEAARFAALAE